jgi:hypothetical protein
MPTTEIISELNALSGAASLIRRRLGISDPGEVLYRFVGSSSETLVVANGLGGAKWLRIEGNYPVDFLTLQEEEFESESAAIEAAEIRDGLVDHA